MKVLLFCFLLINSLMASEYYAKLEPFENYKVKSSVSGKVTFSNEKIEGSFANNSVVVQIDSKVNKIELEQLKKKLKLFNEMIKIENTNYKRLKSISSKSAFEKDTQKLKVVNLESSKADIIVKIETLKDSISNKKLVEKSNYIFNISVKKDDYVTPGTLLYESKDLSKAKLEFFVPISNVESIKNKVIYLDGKKTDLKINKVYEVADASHISSYKVQIVLDSVKVFSRLVKIEFK